MNKIWGAEGKDRKPRKKKKRDKKAWYQLRYGINFFKGKIISEYYRIQEMERVK